MSRFRFVALLVLLWAVVAAAAAAQNEEGTFVAEPAPGSQTAPRGGYFLLDAEPGEEVTQSIGLRNDASRPLELRLAVVDAVTGQRGGASYTLDDEPPSRTGAWITLERSSVTLEPGASAIVSFAVAIPAGADSGEHLAGISIRSPRTPADAPAAGEGEAGASIDVQTRHIIAVQVNLPGPSEPELVIDGVAAVARPDGLYLEIAIDNQGRGLTKATGAINVGDDFERDFEVDTFVPGTSIAYPIKWRAQAAQGRYPAEVELRYGERVARWDGNVTVGDAVLDELAERRVAAPPNPDDDSGLPVTAIAAATIGAAALVIGGGVAVARLRRPVGKHAAKRGRARKRPVGP